MVTEGIDAPGDQPEVADATHRFHAQERTLYVVATPLGNLRDLTLRALDLLQSVDLIAAEDTRVTAVLLRRYGILTRVTSLHEHNEARSVATLLAALSKGQSIALVSDAGTPAISDPGAVEDGLQRLLFALEHDGFAFEAQAFLAGDFADRAFGAEVAVEDDEVAVLLDRVVERADDGLARRDTVSRRRAFRPSSCR